MLSILYDEYLKWGCPNCGCDAIKGSCVSGGGLTSGTCKHCGIHFEIRSNNPTAKHKDSEMCRSCWEELNGIGNKTLGYYTSGQKYLSSKCQEIRTNARRVLESSEREKVCQYCHNHEFDAILEVHHLKGILEFDEDTLIKEINNENNLVWLCPNHHIMLEKGLISLE